MKELSRAKSAAEHGVAADRRPVAANFEVVSMANKALHPRHVARSPRSPAHPAGAAPLSLEWAPAAERRVVRPRAPVLGILALAACVLFAARANAEDALRLSTLQANLLAQEIAKNTPEFIHYAKGTTFSWVMFDLKPDGSPANLTKAVYELFKTKYTIVGSEEELTSEQMRILHAREKVYVDGFRFSYFVRSTGKNRIRVAYSDHEGPLAASMHDVDYEWQGNRWVETGRSGNVIARTRPNKALQRTGASWLLS
jgi:hypothetical protein